MTSMDFRAKSLNFKAELPEGLKFNWLSREPPSKETEVALIGSLRRYGAVHSQQKTRAEIVHREAKTPISTMKCISLVNVIR